MTWHRLIPNRFEVERAAFEQGNKTRCPVHHYHRDGQTRFDGNFGSAVNYQPNSFDGPVEDVKFKEPPLKISGDADRYDHRVGNDDYTQAGNLRNKSKRFEQSI